MSRLVDAETRRYQQRMPDTSWAVRNDPIHNHLVRWMDTMLRLVDLVMEDEGVDAATRAKVIRSVLYGSPNQAEADLRMEQQQLMVTHLERSASTVFLAEGGEQR